jgi:hypothetical protein
MNKIDPIVLVNKAYVTLMNRGHEEDEYMYVCGKCGLTYTNKLTAGACCCGKHEEKENEASDL